MLEFLAGGKLLVVVSPWADSWHRVGHPAEPVSKGERLSLSELIA